MADSGAQNVLTSSIDTQMDNNGDGTYSYNYTVTRPGIITVAILLYTQGRVFNEFFPNQNESGNRDINGTWTDINLPLATRVMYNSVSDYLSANFYYKFKAPVTGTIKFTVVVDDSVSMYISKLKSE